MPGTGLYRIDTTTGNASPIGPIGDPSTVNAIAINTVPEPATVGMALAGLGAIVFGRLRRRK